MNPLSPFTYYRRHIKSALLQIALISLATVGLFILMSVLDAIPLRATVSYLRMLSRVAPTGSALDPAAVSQIQAHPGVERVIPDNGLVLLLPTLLGTDSQRLMGVSPQDAQFLMQHCGVRLQEGRMFEPRSNEFVLSEEIARALDLELGSEIGHTIDKNYYGAVSAPLVLVGILENDPQVRTGPNVRLGFASAAYLNSHERYAPRQTSLLVAAKEGHKPAVDDFLETTVRSRYTEVETFASLIQFFKMGRVAVYVIFGAVNSVVGLAMAFVVGIINRIATSKRLNEFGLLHALGNHRGKLIRRLTLETATVAGIGCLIGLGVALLITSWIKGTWFYDLGMELDLLNPAPFLFVLPIPLITVALTFSNIRQVFGRLDAVGIIERGKLSEETKKHQAIKRSSTKPLSSLTFYLRHRRRGVLMIVGTALMVLGVTLPVFFLSAMTSAMLPYIEYLRYVSTISPIRNELDPGITSQVRSHPAVAHTIPAISLSIQMILPPGGGTSVRVYGVSEADLATLLQVFDMQVQKGRLPRPRSNEIVLSAAVATNRNLHVGDVIGGEQDNDDSLVVDNLPTEMVVVGILAPDRPWVGFASYEYLHSHELTTSQSPHLLIVPHEGQKQPLDRWLQENIDPALAHVAIHDVQEREDKKMIASIILTFAALECMIAAVVAVALVTLNHIFFIQRKEEFGILNAVGRSRMWLMWRTLKETGSVIGLAWFIGAALCGVGLLGMQNLVYGPRGLTLDFFNLAPWLLTLPIPLVVILVSTGTIAWMLSKLDPVAVIERR